MSGEEYDYVLCHEQIHLRRKDYLVKPLAFLALCIHWFNPLAWLSFHLMTCDMEMSCDERVLQSMGEGIKKNYSRSLLLMAAEKQPRGFPLLAFGENDTKRRTKNVLQYKYPKRKSVAVAVCLVAAVSLAMLANPSAYAQQPPPRAAHFDGGANANPGSLRVRAGLGAGAVPCAGEYSGAHGDVVYLAR